MTTIRPEQVTAADDPVIPTIHTYCQSYFCRHRWCRGHRGINNSILTDPTRWNLYEVHLSLKDFRALVHDRRVCLKWDNEGTGRSIPPAAGSHIVTLMTVWGRRQDSNYCQLMKL